MKRRLPVFLLAALVLAGAPSENVNVARQLEFAPAERADHPLRIMTWNIDRGSTLNTLTEELEKNPAALCMLQEVDWNAERSGQKDIGAELAKSLHMNLAYGIEFEELSQERGHPAYIGQATLTRLPIRRARILRFKRQSTFWMPHAWLPSSLPLMQRRLGGRLALVTDLEFAGRLLVVYNPHLESRSAGPIQMAQLDEILADLAQYPSNTPAIIGGDLNTKYFPSVYLHKLERLGFKSATGQRIQRTHTIMMSLDWIFARGVSLSEGSVRQDIKGSDHYPVYAQMSVQP